MKLPPKPQDEIARLASLSSYEVLDTLPEQSFDDLTLLASHICQTPIALISLIDESRQWFKSKVGLDVSETPRDFAFCAHAILDEDILIVPDATKDDRFSDNPLVIGDPNVLFYAGAQLKTSSGYNIGTLCVIDHIPRTISTEQISALKCLARQVISQFELRRSTISNLRSSKLIENSPAIMFCKDYRSGKGIYVELNIAAEKLFGLKKSEALGKTDYDFFPKKQADFFLEKDLEILKSGKQTCIEQDPVNFPNGEKVKLRTWKVPVNDTDGKPRYLLEISLDITKQVETEKQLLQAMQQAESASIAKSAFLANMSHEIRTPMNAIIGVADLLIETELSAVQKRYVEMFKRAGDSLLNLINDILDISKIESGHLNLEKIDFNLRSIAEDAIEMMTTKAYNKNLNLSISYKNNLNEFFIGDPYRIKQIISNLINNAVKFTNSGEVKLEIEANTSSKPGNILITVKDTGIGIASDKIDNLFQSFSQVDDSVTRKFGGTGLGLAICKRLTNLMNGDIWATSQPGRGSAFSFTLMIPEAAKQNFMPDQDKLQSLSGIKLLVIDDHATNRFIIRQMVEPWGLTVTEAISGEKGLELAFQLAQQNNRPDIILVDNVMKSELNGVKFTEILRRHNSYISTPIIVFTSDSWLLDHNEARKLGVTSFMYKPIRRDDLFAALSNSLFDKNKQAPQKQTQVETKVSEFVRPLKILLVDDAEDNRTLFKAFLKDQIHEIVEASNGQLAYEKAQTGTFDIIFMDLQMPLMDGYQSTQLIRSWEKESGRQPHLIIALTAYALKEEQEKCLAMGCNQHLTKPIKKQTILSVLNSLSIRPKNAA